MDCMPYFNNACHNNNLMYYGLQANSEKKPDHLQLCTRKWQASR